VNRKKLLYIYFACEVIFMKKLWAYMLGGFIFVLITGTLAHFTYEFSGKNLLVGIFTPINESAWEHMKLIFYPGILSVFILKRIMKMDSNTWITALKFGCILATLFIPLFFCGYIKLLGKDIFFLDIADFVIAAFLIFFCGYVWRNASFTKGHRYFANVVIFVLFICFLMFTINPPDVGIFREDYGLS
jgi:hypothetical protein